MQTVEYEKRWTFPAGERGLKILQSTSTRHLIRMDFKTSDDIIDMLLTVDALRREYGVDVNIYLNVPYFPYARQDRKMQQGESHSLKVIADLVNSCKFKEVFVADAHSDVLEALVDNIKIKTQTDCIIETLGEKLFTYDYILAPDAGAMKKAYKTAMVAKVPCICANKVRDVRTGEITGVSINTSTLELEGKKVLVVDDICDGGKTFLELRKVLPKNMECHLYVTHGIFSKGKEELNTAYSEIFCYNDMRSISN